MTPPLVSLGYAPAGGREAVDQCVKFKTLMREAIGRDPAGAYLKTVSEDGRRGLAVEYDPGVVGAEAWARAAELVAPAIWELAGRAEKCRTK